MGNFVGAAHSDRHVLVGRIATMDGNGTVHLRGAVCIEADRIAAVVADPAHLPDAFAGFPPLETGGTIYPGLIELHNHLSYNFLPLWTVPKPYTNRNQWREHEPDYKISISLPAKVIGANADVDYPRSIARFVECRSLLGGTTTTQGLSAGGGVKWYKGLTRNVEAPHDPAFPAASGQTLDYAPPEIAEKLVPALQKDRPFFYHLSEGTDADARQRFFDLEYVPNTWAIESDLIPIHCVALQPGDFQRLNAAAGMVWSPLSNLLLYGTTADVVAAKASQMPIALGSDWSPSGSKNLLGELKIARMVSDHLGGLFSLEELARMVTSAPARMLGWHGQVGSIARGLKADLLVLEGTNADVYEQLLTTRENDVLAVVIDGRPRYGRLGFLDFDVKNQERVVVGGKDYVLDLTEEDDDPLAGLSLGTAIAKLTYGLAHLPELAASAPKPTIKGFDAIARNAIAIDFEMEEDEDFTKLQHLMRAAAPQLKPLPMSPITAIDDPNFIPSLKANVNLPDYLKQAF
ncbi:amidohydrolase family protein [Rhizobium leguminosarum]|uniref:amidohydrolase family protein n=1 Tax=Rhizobium leguminosarum TaxID=384 RepID=UPI001C9077E1|nr:amidohydrolase family protein [Rhizobium leguminosarum]MBY3031161.1 amidohydrolase family protein [Rhizobium leguminosarum]